MTKRLNGLALLVVLLLVWAGDASSAPPVKPPNVLFIAIDDLNDWVACSSSRFGHFASKLGYCATRDGWQRDVGG
jgi:hypothetical protein